MQGERVVVGVYSYLDDVLRAAEAVKKRGLDFKVYSPFASHDIEHAVIPEKSPVRFVTLTGGILGCTFGFALAILCSLDWPLRVSAKSIVSIPGFFVIGYECTILFGALATLFALLHFCRVPWPFRVPGYDARFSIDKFGIVVGCNRNDVDALRNELAQTGAEEVNVDHGL